MTCFARRTLSTFALFAILAATSPLWGGSPCTLCGQPCQHEVQMVKKEIMVPKWSTERRMVNVTRMVPEVRTRHYVARRLVPEVRQVPHEIAVTVPVVHQREVREVIHVPVYRQVEQHYTDYVPVYRDVRKQVIVNVPRWEDVREQVQVMVPHVERKVGTRTVCQMVPDVEIRTVCRDEGHYVNRSYKVSCGGGCGGCGKVHYDVCRVWVPKMVTHQVEVPVMRPKMVAQPYEYNVTVFRPELREAVRRVCHYEPVQREVVRRVCDYRPVDRTRMVRVCEMQPRERVRNVSYVEYETRREVRMVNETHCRVVEEPRSENYVVCVPRVEQQEIVVPVCHMVPTTITVPATCDSCSGGYASLPGRLRRWLWRW